jgi:soluble lytic murein transglycosylase-like protein
VRATVGAGTAAGVLLLGAPLVSQGLDEDPSRMTVGPAEEVSLALVAARTHRWPGHPGRRLRTYRVRPGDTAAGLAVRFHAWTAELRAINHLGRHARLFAGQRITIPVVVAATRRHAAAKHTARHRAHRHPKPWRHADASRATVRRTVVRTARRYGVDPHLALALAWQESGWQQRRISSAGAVGAMQVLPATGSWMSLYVGRRLNVYGLRDNIVTGVVLYKVLRGQTTWHRSIAAYYQGLRAVRRHGVYPSARRYTRSVVALYHRLDRGWNPA